ncbi:MAG: hypothetical protein H3C58_06060 [Fimbriimonadaceae bacterium]|nr:hypothetical protein [Fimbriimonadaceae bacterium]
MTLILLLAVVFSALGCRDGEGTVNMTEEDKAASANVQKQGGTAAPMPTEGVDN